jgi:hypothetical protein
MVSDRVVRVYLRSGSIILKWISKKYDVNLSQRACDRVCLAGCCKPSGSIKYKEFLDHLCVCYRAIWKNMLLVQKTGFVYSVSSDFHLSWAH